MKKALLEWKGAAHRHPQCATLHACHSKVPMVVAQNKNFHNHSIDIKGEPSPKEPPPKCRVVVTTRQNCMEQRGVLHRNVEAASHRPVGQFSRCSSEGEMVV